MKKVIIILLAVYGLCGAQTMAKVAVLDLTGQGVAPVDLGIASDRLRDEIIITGKFGVIDRDRLNEALKEIKARQTPCENKDCISEIGQALGVLSVVQGSIDKTSNGFKISLAMIDVITGNVLKSVEKEVAGSGTEGLKDGVHEIAKLLVAKPGKGANGETLEKTIIEKAQDTSATRLAAHKVLPPSCFT
ncbi:MAG: hypothetical protein PHC61_18060 [Chitinivibrionales bacterium]|nr:hypothetical protein [Chitinivibrionales bacterium]